MIAMINTGAAIMAICKATMLTAICDQLLTCGTSRLAKNPMTNKMTPHSMPSANDGVSPRSRIKCRSQGRSAHRSLSRNRTDSLLNWLIAQRMASQQQMAVTPTTGNTKGRASAYLPSTNDCSRSSIPVTGIKLVPQFRSTAGTTDSIISGSVMSSSGIR